MSDLKIIIWGTGQFESQIFKEGISANIIGFISENEATETEHRGLPIFKMESLPDDYDFIVVALDNSDAAYSLAEKKMNLEKICFLRAGSRYRRFNHDPRIKCIFSEKRWNMYLAEYGVTKGSFIEDDEKKYESLNVDETFIIDHNHFWPIVGDKYAMNGSGWSINYLLQDLWGARRIIQIHAESSCITGIEKTHWDIGSSVGGFLAHVLSAGIKVNAVDVRPFPIEISGMKTICADATILAEIADESIFSFSALCSIEHFGLGRYGDEINPSAWKKCINSVQKKVIPGGHIVISVPIGKQRLEFNAHRIFYPRTIIDQFDKSELIEFDVVNSTLGIIEEDVELTKYDELDKGYLVGLFHFMKK